MLSRNIAALATAAVLTLSFVAEHARAAETRDIGSRRELFVDDFLIDRLSGRAEQKLQFPEPQEVVLVTDKPWEGNTSAYYTIFQDGDLFRMYYRGSHWDVDAKKATHPEVACYAESKDGIHWTRPEIGVVEFNGSKANNIVWAGLGGHNFTPFKDENPACSNDARYKAFAFGSSNGDKGGRGLYALQSADGIRWSLMSEQPVITVGAFDSQNLAFWDPVRKVYADYHRHFRDGKRDIMTCTSADFLKWTEPQFLEISGAPREHLYTNAVRPYARAPHLLVGFPTRYLANAEQQVEPTFMTSRDGLKFHRWPEAVISRDAPEDRDGNRSNYMTHGLLQLPGDDRHLSVYATEAYYTGPDSRVRRFTYRVDGFVAIEAPADGGEVLTPPIVFAGDQLSINAAAADGGSVRVELQTADGKPVDGLSLADVKSMNGDEIAHTVRWNGDDGGRSQLAKLAGQPIRLRFELKNAKLYSLQFGQAK